MRNGASKATNSDQGKQIEAPPKTNPNKGMTSKTQSSPLSKPLAPKTKEADKTPTSFILEHELRKIKIPIPLMKFLKNEPFKKSIMKVLQPTPSVSSDALVYRMKTQPLLWAHTLRIFLMLLLLSIYLRMSMIRSFTIVLWT
jgi:hypothetical protein